MIAVIYAAFAIGFHWAGANPLRLAFLVGAGAITFQIAVLVSMARNR